jgi:molybdopterin biosynthesis enzyme
MVGPDPGEAVRILTGAPIPLGVDAVVMEEQVRIVGRI